VWSDVKKTAEEAALKHPAMFPAALPKRLIECFAAPGDRVVLDPFAGMGSTLIAAAECGMAGIGLELSEEYCGVAKGRLEAKGCKVAGIPRGVYPEPQEPPRYEILRFAQNHKRRARNDGVLHRADARRVAQYVAPGSVDLIITSPPYWDILSRRRTADRKAPRTYRADGRDLGKIGDYAAFLEALREVFAGCLQCLRAGGFALVVVMDLRKRDRFYALHADLAALMQEVGFIFDDLIIWDRRQEYNNLRPLGYPSVFRINKAHEYVLIFKKP